MSKNRITVRYILCFVLAIGLVLSINNTDSNASLENNSSKKVVVLVLDRISLKELSESETPNIDRLLENGSMGLMNVRSRSSVANQASTYLSLGMGVKSATSTKASLAFNRDSLFPLSEYDSLEKYVSASDLYHLYTGNTVPRGEILNVSVGDVRKSALNITPNNEIGLLGKKARENNLTVGLLGNSDLDSPSRETSLIAMDEKGAIPLGSVNKDLLTTDSKVLGGVRLDQNKLLAEFDRIIPDTDILFVDYGDPERIEKSIEPATDFIKETQKIKAIERADSFLLKITERVDLENTMFMIVTPNPSSTAINNGNFALTPFIVSGNNLDGGLLTSKTTRREGLVTNFNFAPTILDYFDIENNKEFIGGSIESVSNDNATETLLENEKGFLYLRKYRRVFHGLFIALSGLSLLGLYISKFIKWKGLPKKLLSYLSLTTVSIPLPMMLVSIIGYKFIVLDVLFVIGGAFLTAYFLKKVFKDNLKVISIIAFATSVFLLIDIYFIKTLMIVSPLGSDAIAGGRFYGIGNDYMGILLGSSLLSVFSFFNSFDIQKHTMAIFTTLYMSLVVLALSPFFGANIGGTLSAMLVTIIALFVILDKKFSFKKIIAIGLVVLITVLAFAALDISFNPNPTHAGKALEGLISDGSSKFIEIVSIKLRQVFWNLLNASWNIILLLQVILTVLLYKSKSTIFKEDKDKYPRLLKGFLVTLIGGLIVFLLNDTGTIAAAIMLIYMFIPLGLLLNDN